MKITKNRLKTTVSILSILSVLTFFSLTSLAAFEQDKPQAGGVTAPLPAITGTLTKAQREVNINGLTVNEGVTVLDGSLIRTVTDGRAIIDIPSLGTADQGMSTETMLEMMGKNLTSRLYHCGSIKLTLLAGITGTVKVMQVIDRHGEDHNDHHNFHVKVYRGSVVVKRLNDKENTMTAGSHKTFDDVLEVTGVGDAEFKVFCDDDKIVPLAFLPLAGLLAIPFGGDNGINPQPVLSPLTP